MSLYPYVEFRNMGTVVKRTYCNNTDISNPRIFDTGCPYINFLNKQGYSRGYRVEGIGRITHIELNFGLHSMRLRHYAKETNLPKPENFCATCPYNRGR